MLVKQYTSKNKKDFDLLDISNIGFNPDLILVFGSTNRLRDKAVYSILRSKFINSIIFGCSTAGEIAGINVYDESIILNFIKFNSTKIVCSRIEVKKISDSYNLGLRLAENLSKEGLKHVFVLSDGLKINGSELVSGLKTVFKRDVSITGGLAGDGGDMVETLIIGNDYPESGIVSLIGFYGENIEIGYGSYGGWDTFGPDRLITKSRQNILFEMDGKSALDLYKKYLGDHAKGLPATGLLFPLRLQLEGDLSGVVRTVLSVDEKKKSMTFAGNLPEGGYVRLMKANIDRLIDGAMEAAKISKESTKKATPDLAILISCVGRKMVMKQRVEEEIEGVNDVLGKNTIQTGFYSYGEISPFNKAVDCQLHNQTMTITTITEK